MLRLRPTAPDYTILAIYFVVVLGIGFVARLAIKTDIDFFLSGRSLPACDARVQRGDVRCRHGAHLRRQPLRARTDRPPDPRLVGDGGHPRRGRPRARLHHARRPDIGDLQRGAAVLHQCRGAAAADDRRAALVRRDRRPQGEGEAFKPLGDPGLHAWQGLGIHHVTNPLASDWVGVVFGLGFVLSFGYWTTNFAEVQRALSARNMSAARRTPLIGAYAKIFLPAIIILPGLIAVLTVHGLGGSDVNVQYNTAIPHLIGEFLPEGMLGLAVTGLLAALMAGAAANVTAFNTVVTYDIVQSYFAKDRDSAYYLRAWRRDRDPYRPQHRLRLMSAETPPTPPNPDEPQALSDEEEIRAARTANRLDIRRLIGGLFVLYGVILTITGIVGSSHVKTKAAGINLNLWTGIGMLIFGVLMIVWALTRPVAPEPPETSGEGSGRIRRAPAT
jgi:Sodium:solute symporter family